MTQVPFAPPQRFDEYRLLRTLGEGAMGQVVLCMDTSLHRRVAVKFLKGVELDPSLQERFWVEARAIARLSHPNIVTIYRVGQHRGTPYFVSEYVDGQSLDRVPLPLPWQKVLPIALGITRGLDAAHRSGVLHRDIKPANIIISSRGDVKLLDFGLAKVIDNLAASGMSGVGFAALVDSSTRKLAPVGTVSETLPPAKDSSQRGAAGEIRSLSADGPPNTVLLTEAGMMMGTPLYMSPEAWRGEAATPRGDVYSLGVVLYELLCGHPPHQAPTCDALQELVLSSPAPSIASLLPALPTEFATIVDRCLQAAAKDRFVNGTEVLGALEALGAHAIQSAAESKRRSVLLVGAAVTVVGVAASTVYFVHERQTRQDRWPTGTVQISSGTFTLGSTSDEQESALGWCKQVAGNDCGQEEQSQFAREQSLHRVIMSPFRIDRTEVTNSTFVDWLNKQSDLSLTENRYLYQGTVLLADLYPTYQPSNGFVYNRRTGRYEVPKGSERYPVTRVTWEAAQRYCQSHGMRLPTEAEWEFAARGIEGRPFPWGFESPQCEHVNVARFQGQSCSAMKGNTVPVASATQDVTPDGVYDLAGNVAEWVMDAFLDTYPDCPEPCRDPQVVPEVLPGQRRQRAVRGGSWNWSVWSTRSASRSRWWADEAVQNIGFRCVASVK